MLSLQYVTYDVLFLLLFDSVNPNLAEYVDPAACLVADRTRIGDGRCDAGIELYNTEACNWDGGDWYEYLVHIR